MKSLYKYSNFTNGANFKDLDVKQGIVTGYLSSFDTVDVYKEVVRFGAFKKSISENFNRIKHLQNHNPHQPLGKFLILVEDKKGLYYESKIGSHNLGVDFLKMVESGLITEHSIGYKNIQQNRKDTYTELTEVKLFEGSSLTGWGVNENTPLTGVKSLEGIKVEDIEARVKSLEKFCKNSDATDETIELLLLEQKQLAQIILNLKQTNTPPVVKTEVSLAKVKEAIQFFNYKNSL
jgi:hypothetical protein